MIETLHVTIMDQSGSKYYNLSFILGNSSLIEEKIHVGENKSYIIWPTKILTQYRMFKQTKLDSSGFDTHASV